MAVSVATIKAWVEARVPEKVLIDLTNQYISTATTVDTTTLEAYIQDAIELFETAVGDEPYEEHYHDRMALKSLSVVIMYLYAESSSLLNFHMSMATQGLTKALIRRYSQKPNAPTDQEKQQFSNHQTFINSLPSALKRTND